MVLPGFFIYTYGYPNIRNRISHEQQYALRKSGNNFYSFPFVSQNVNHIFYEVFVHIYLIRRLNNKLNHIIISIGRVTQEFNWKKQINTFNSVYIPKFTEESVNISVFQKKYVELISVYFLVPSREKNVSTTYRWNVIKVNELL